MGGTTNKNILITGGAGYIGAHMVRVLLEAGCRPIVFDNLENGRRDFVPKGVPLFKGDLRYPEDLQAVFKKYPVEAVMHFAAYIVVPESVRQPLKYYENNTLASLNLIKAMLKNKVKKLIFSSTAAVYGEPRKIPVTERSETNPANPYGQSKLMAEKIIADAAQAHNFSYISFRYFNAAGAQPNGQIGYYQEPSTHLLANALKVAGGRKKVLEVFGDNYPTPDGTGIRDYIHVLDICRAHLLGLKALSRKSGKSVNGIFNLGCGRGYSVKEVIKMTEMIAGRKLKVKISPRRLGDLAVLVADSSKARRLLGWRPRFDLEDIIRTAWRWEQHRQKENTIV